MHQTPEESLARPRDTVLVQSVRSSGGIAAYETVYFTATSAAPCPC